MPNVDSRQCYHVVCRDCRTEYISERASEAETLMERHAEETGHLVVYEAVE